MNKQEAIYRMFASRAAVLENESRRLPPMPSDDDFKQMVSAAALSIDSRADLSASDEALDFQVAMAKRLWSAWTEAIKP